MKEKMNAGLNQLNIRLDQEIQMINDDFSKKSDLLYKALKAGKITEDEYKSNVHKVKILRDKEILDLKLKYVVEEEKIYSESIDDKFSKKKDLLDKALKVGKINEKEYNFDVNTIEMLRDKEILDLKLKYVVEEEKIYSESIDEHVKELNEFGNSCKEVRDEKIRQLEKQIKNVETEIEGINKKYEDGTTSIEKKYENKAKEMKSKLSEYETEKLKKDTLMVPYEEREEMARKVLLGIIILDEIDELEIARAGETIENIKLEKISQAENENKISLGKEYAGEIEIKEEQLKALNAEISKFEEEKNDITKKLNAEISKLEKEKSDITKKLNAEISKLEKEKNNITKKYKQSKAEFKVYIPNDINKDFER